MHEKLDNPVWHALRSRHAHLSTHHGAAACYPEDVSPLAGLQTVTQAALADMAEIVPPGAAVGIVGIEELPLPSGVWQPAGALHLVQMVCDAALPRPDDLAALPLGAEDADAMLALVEATEPGPFRRRTGSMGRYVGIRDGDRLVAMAGERLALEGYTEISAVCTAPDHRGRGLATELVKEIGSAIQAAGDVPFLHVHESNRGAIRLYETLGFRQRAARPLSLLLRC